MRCFHRCLHALFALVVCGLLAFPSQSYSVSVVDVPESAAYSLVYSLDIPNTGNFRNGTSVPYAVNNSASIGLYDRIAYHLELDTGSGSEFVYVSMDAFDVNASRIGLPHSGMNPVARQQVVTNMNVFSNSANVTTGTGLAGGSIEMWPSNYNPTLSGYVGSGSNTQFDFHDNGFNAGQGYGSFQVHNTAAGETLIGYNRWGTTGNSDLGIGNQPAGNPDWTFAGNAATYTVKSLEVLVREVNPPAGVPFSVPDAPANITANASEANAFKVVYELPIDNTTFNPSQYVQDHSALIPDGSYDRIGYYLELETANGSEFVWVSMDAFNLEADRLGIPNTADHIRQLIVENMNVVSNSGSITDVTGVQGNVEFWHSNYGGGATNLIPGGTNAFDYDDTRTAGGTGYGSFQIHNFGLEETLIAYNRWNDGTVSDLGIGNQPTGNPDWTFASAQQPIGANDYTVKNLFILVRPIVPEPATVGLVLLGGAALMRRRRNAA